MHYLEPPEEYKINRYVPTCFIPLLHVFKFKLVIVRYLIDHTIAIILYFDKLILNFY